MVDNTIETTERTSYKYIKYIRTTTTEFWTENLGDQAVASRKKEGDMVGRYR